MPVLKRGGQQIDFTDTGEGIPVILIHSSVSGNRQWRKLSSLLEDRYRVIAINLFGYGQTSPWSNDRPQSLADQAALVLELCAITGYPVNLVGHSFGGAVALQAAALLPQQIAGLVLLEPNPFFLLEREECRVVFEEIKALCDIVKLRGQEGDWPGVAALFVDYWSGEGAWLEMGARRKEIFLRALPNILHEWDAVIAGSLSLESWEASSAKTLVLRAVNTRRPIHALAALFSKRYPQWDFVEIPEGGHMAPLTHPDLVNPLVAGFLDGIGQG